MQLVINGEKQSINPCLGLGAVYALVERLERDHGYKTTIKSCDVIALTKGV